jgi:hypothetical protein
LKTRLFVSTAQNFLINDLNRHFRAASTDADRMSLVRSVHLR